MSQTIQETIIRLILTITITSIFSGHITLGSPIPHLAISELGNHLAQAPNLMLSVPHNLISTKSTVPNGFELDTATLQMQSRIEEGEMLRQNWLKEHRTIQETEDTRRVLRGGHGGGHGGGEGGGHDDGGGGGGDGHGGDSGGGSDSGYGDATPGKDPRMNGLPYGGATVAARGGGRDRSSSIKTESPTMVSNVLPWFILAAYHFIFGH